MLTFSLIASIVLFGIMTWLNNLIKNSDIVAAAGCYMQDYGASISLIPSLVIIIPITMTLYSIAKKINYCNMPQNKSTGE